MSKKENKPTGFFELIIDPSIFKGSRPEKRKKIAEVVHEVAAVEKEIGKIVYYDPYTASSLATSHKYLAIIEEARLKFNSSDFVLIGCHSKGGFANVSLSSPYIGKDYQGTNILDRFMLFF